MALGIIISLLGGLCRSEVVGRERDQSPRKKRPDKKCLLKAFGLFLVVVWAPFVQVLVHWQMPSVSYSNDDLNCEALLLQDMFLSNTGLVP